MASSSAGTILTAIPSIVIPPGRASVRPRTAPPRATGLRRTRLNPALIVGTPFLIFVIALRSATFGKRLSSEINVVWLRLSWVAGNGMGSGRSRVEHTGLPSTRFNQDYRVIAAALAWWIA